MKKIISTILIFMTFGAVFAREINIKVRPGQHWKEKREPQIALWLEDSGGNYIRTLYVTERAGHKSWIFGPKEGRPESLPVWYGASKSGSIASKAEASPSSPASPSGTKASPSAESTSSAPSPSLSRSLDAVTGATPKSELNLTAQMEEGDYIIKSEFNNSFDYNDFYTKKSSGVNGQPSVVYSAKIPANLTAGQEISLDFAGTGSLTGGDGSISKNTQNLTTAKEIVKSVSVRAN